MEVTLTTLVEKKVEKMLLLPKLSSFAQQTKVRTQHIAFLYFSPVSLPKWLFLYKPNFLVMDTRAIDAIKIASLIRP